MEHSERKHALLSASSASRWMNCTPSARLEEAFPDEGTSRYAEEGTLAHEFAEITLRKFTGEMSTRKYNAMYKDLQDRKDSNGEELYDPEMDKEVEKYTSIVIEEFRKSQKLTKDAILSIEEKIDLTEFIEDGFGTGDAIIIADTTLKIIDLKYGKGLKVKAQDNPQLMLYALGALIAYELFYDIQTVEMSIVQPRLDHFDTFVMKAENLKLWADREVRPKAKQAYAGEGLQKAGDHCRWCKAAPRCATLAAQNMWLLDDEFRDPRLLRDDHMIDIFNKKDQIIKWIGSLSDYMLKEALQGKKWKGLKLVEGRSNRKWLNEEEIVSLLRSHNFTDEQILNIKLKGIGEIEKLLGKKEFPAILGEQVVKPKGAPTLTSSDDKRPEFNNAEDDFGINQ